MFNTAIAGNKDTGILTLEGELNLQNSQSLKDAFVDVLNRFQEIIVRIDHLDQIDFSCFQVFCAANKSASTQNKTLTIVPPGNEPYHSLFYRQLELSGFAAQEEKTISNGATALPGARGFILREGI